MILHDFLSELSDVLFPPLCLICSRALSSVPPEVVCSDCLASITFLTGGRCPICGIIFPDSPSGDHLCGSCLEHRPSFTRARAAVAYEGPILEAIHQFKYGRNITKGAALSRFLADFDFDDMDWRSFDVMIPVPLHLRRLRERGFNQSLILARTLGKEHRVEVDFSLLKRHKLTLTQTGLDKKEREKNIKNAFEVVKPQRLYGKKIILVDDVYTTGATLNECAKTLKKAGAADVTVVTLARVL